MEYGAANGAIGLVVLAVERKSQSLADFGGPGVGDQRDLTCVSKRHFPVGFESWIACLRRLLRGRYGGALAVAWRW